jgi:hypothetical protein
MHDTRVSSIFLFSCIRFRRAIRIDLSDHQLQTILTYSFCTQLPPFPRPIIVSNFLLRQYVLPDLLLTVYLCHLHTTR